MAWYVSAAIGFMITALAVIALRPLAVTLNLIDRPGGRKTHLGEVPVVGGLAMFVGAVVGLGLLRLSPDTPVALLTAAFGLLVVVGLLDDRFSLSPWIRLPVHAGVALLLLKFSDCQIVSLGDAFGLGAITFSGAQVYVASILLIVAAINAFNMMDGMDGLAGTTAGVALGALGLAAGRGGDLETMAVCFVLVGAVCGFLLFNVPVPWRRSLRCFMGDAGSTFLGVAVAWAMIRLSQHPATELNSVSPVTALWIGGLPLFELVWSFMRRVGRGRSPFVADAEHFHHLLIRAGFSVRGAFALMLLLACVLATIGLALGSAGVSEYWSLSLLTVTGVLIVRSMYRVGFLLEYLPRQARRSPAP
jgi:UDP-GlcNAc:undecaprenyl-phosphate/decaprenyl-phosphate GlcNAc-1-phosphate transferase